LRIHQTDEHGLDSQKTGLQLGNAHVQSAEIQHVLYVPNKHSKAEAPAPDASEMRNGFSLLPAVASSRSFWISAKVLLVLPV